MSKRWEKLEEGFGSAPDFIKTASASLKVDGGTLYRTMAYRESQGAAPVLSVTFVADVIKPVKTKTPPFDASAIDDVAMRELLDCKDVGKGREVLRRILVEQGVL